MPRTPAPRNTAGAGAAAAAEARVIDYAGERTPRSCVMGLPARGGPGLGASGAAQTNRCC